MVFRILFYKNKFLKASLYLVIICKLTHKQDGNTKVKFKKRRKNSCRIRNQLKIMFWKRIWKNHSGSTTLRRTLCQFVLLQYLFIFLLITRQIFVVLYGSSYDACIVYCIGFVLFIHSKQRKFIDWKKTKLFRFRWNWVEEKNLRGIRLQISSFTP